MNLLLESRYSDIMVINKESHNSTLSDLPFIEEQRSIDDKLAASVSNGDKESLNSDNCTRSTRSLIPKIDNFSTQ